MLEVFGWIVIVILTGIVTLGYILLALNSLGRYTIGGVPNRPIEKFLTIAIGAFGLFIWYVIFSIAPFTVALRG